MNYSDTFLVDGQHLTAEECRKLFSDHFLSDRQMKVIDRVEGERLLDIGCYAGLFVKEAIRRYPDQDVRGIDYFDDNVRLSQMLHPEISEHYSRMSAYDLKFPDAHFGCVTLQEVLEHLEGAVQAVKEINRVLKVGGTLIVSVPNPFYIRAMLEFFRFELGNAWRRLHGRGARLSTEIFFKEIEWNRHIFSWTPQTLLTLLVVNGFEYVEHCYENGMPNRIERSILNAFPFLGPTQILKVRKTSAAPSSLV